jgi:hypothetical protein
MPEFMTVQFPNTAAGQAAKTRKLAELSRQGWSVVSETITAGEFNKEKACCFFMIFAPCAFLAGSKEGTINVPLSRDTGGGSFARGASGKAFCSSCGAKLPANSAFCSSCGSPQ